MLHAYLENVSRTENQYYRSYTKSMVHSHVTDF